MEADSVQQIVCFFVTQIKGFCMPYHAEYMFVRSLIATNAVETLELCFPYLKYRHEFANYINYAVNFDAIKCFDSFIEMFTIYIDTDRFPVHTNIDINKLFYKLMISHKYKLAERLVPILYIRTLKIENIIVHNKIFDKIIENRHLASKATNGDKEGGWDAFVEFLLYNFDKSIVIPIKCRNRLFKTLLDIAKSFVTVDSIYKDTGIYYMLCVMAREDWTSLSSVVKWSCKGLNLFTKLFFDLESMNCGGIFSEDPDQCFVWRVISNLSLNQHYDLLMDFVRNWLDLREEYNNPLTKNSLGSFLLKLSEHVHGKEDCKFIRKYLFNDVKIIKQTIGYVMSWCHDDLIRVLLHTKKKKIPFKNLIIFLRYIDESTYSVDDIKVIVIHVYWYIDISERYSDDEIYNIYHQFRGYLHDVADGSNLYDVWLSNKEIPTHDIISLYNEYCNQKSII